MSDFAYEILSRASGMNDDQRADAWQHYQDSASSDELHQRLQSLPLPAETHHALVAAKEYSTPPVDHVAAAMKKMETMNPELLRLCETHPAVLQAILTSVKD